MDILIEFNFKWIGKKIKAEDYIKKIEDILKNFDDIKNYKTVSITSMSKWFVVLINFPDDYNIDDVFERILDAFAGAVVYCLDGNIRYRHYEVHGKTGSLIYHTDWRNLIALNIIAKDEGQYIKDFIEKHKFFFDDIVVIVDKETADNTADEARSIGARVFFEDKNDDFSKLRNKTLDETDSKIKWILKLDVDEEMSPELMKNIRQLCLDDNYDGYEFIIDNQKTKEQMPQLRLFRKLSNVRWEGNVHEILRGIETERICKTDYKIIHYQRWIATGGKVAEERNKEYRRLEDMKT